MISIDRLDHLVLTVKDLDATCRFYEDVLGMATVSFEGGRRALNFGRQKINLHEAGNEPEPRSVHPTPGSGDLCFITGTPMDEIVAHLETCGVAIEEGPDQRTGAIGPINSVYCRDPDGNLIEISNYM